MKAVIEQAVGRTIQPTEWFTVYAWAIRKLEMQNELFHMNNGSEYLKELIIDRLNQNQLAELTYADAKEKMR